MRKIEQTMLNAIRLKKDLQGGNTKVFYMGNTGNPHGDRSEIFLHGNHIADYWHVSGTVEVNERTLRDYPTVTTRSRLRALGVNVYMKKGVLFLDDTPCN